MPLCSHRAALSERVQLEIPSSGCFLAIVQRERCSLRRVVIMIVMKRLATLVLAICVPCMAQTTSAQKAAPKVTNSWPKEPDGFNLAKFGMSEQQINELFTVDGCYPSHTGDRYCGTKLDAGDRFWGIPLILLMISW
jgi:hypothetical protein